MKYYKAFLRVFCAVGMTCAATVARAAEADKDFDLACAVTAAAEVATSEAGSEQRSAALEANVFFLGRLSGRDPETYWSAVVKGKLAELRQSAKSPEFYSRCLNFLTQQF